jgi:hypothetical protein
MRLIHQDVPGKATAKEAILHGRESEKRFGHCSPRGHKEGTHIHSLTLFHEACEDCIWWILHQRATDTYFGAQNPF